MDIPRRRTRLAALAALALAALTASTSGVLVRRLGCGALTIAGVRSAIGALVFAAVLRGPRLSCSRVQLTGAVVFALHTYVFFAAMRLTTVANTVFLAYTAPLFVPLFSAWIVRERAGRDDWWSALVVVGGVGLFFCDRLAPAGWWGNLLAVAAGVTFAWYTVVLRHRQQQPLATLVLANLLTAAGAVPAVLADPPVGTDWGVLLLLGVFQFGLTYVLISWAIQRVTAMEAMLVLTLEPVFAALWAGLFVGERPGRWAAVGAAVVLCGVLLRALRQSPAAAAEPAVPPHDRCAAPAADSRAQAGR